MNLDILNTEIQEFINSNLKSDTSDLILKGIPFPQVDPKLIIEQIEAKRRCEKKLPTWFSTENVYFPNKLNVEQTSSEVTARYKANIVSGNSLIDLTGGFGIDTYYFSKQIKAITHCEINSELSSIANHNFSVLGSKNINCKNANGIEALKQLDSPFDWIYLDPSRRDKTKRKVFLLSDCEPNIKTFQNLFFKYSKNVMIKTSPLLDITATLLDLKNVKQIQVVGVNNEVKELLCILERDYNNGVTIKTVNIRKSDIQQFDFLFEEEPKAEIKLSKPLNYLYEPNSAILKAGAFNAISVHFNIPKLHKHSHLYTSEELIDFPGRQFKIEKQIAFNKKLFVKEKITKANITIRNFSLSVNDIRKKLNIKEGGTTYLFFTTDLDDKKTILVCSKIQK